MRGRIQLASARPKSATCAIVAAACATFLGSAMAAHAQGRAVATKMFISSCEEMGSCELRLTCQSGGSPVEMIPAAIATNPESLQINKSLEIVSFPATLSCTLFEDDGWFGSTWDEAATGSLSVSAGGDYVLKLSNPEQATVEISFLVDSYQSALSAPGTNPSARPAKTAPRQFLGIFRKEIEPKGHAVVLGLEWSAFQRRIKELADKGVHPTDLETWVDGGKRLWSGIFRSGPDTSLVVTDLEWEPFTKRWQKLADDEEMRLIDVEVYQQGGKTLFAGAFQNGTEQYSLWVGQDRQAFLLKTQQLINQGLRLIDIEIYKVGGRNLYAGVYLEAEGSYGMWNAVEWDKFKERWQRAGGSGLADIESYTEGGKRLYDGIILGGGTEELPGTLDASALAAKWREMSGKGYRLIHLEPIE